MENKAQANIALVNSKSRQRIVVVLGMHRSGTSAVTRALKVLGVSLGDSLMPPAEGNNSKGFWEDTKLNQFNISLLLELGLHWDSVCPVTQADADYLCNKGFLSDAAFLLRERMDKEPVFGFKDPRVAKLMPFWERVFESIDCEVCYVLAVRNPVSVIKSLENRDGFCGQKSYLLWLDYVTSSIAYCADKKVFVIDFDRLIQNPVDHLHDLAAHFDLVIDEQQLSEYETDFLDSELRHSVCEQDEVERDARSPKMLAGVYSLFLSLASEQSRIYNAEFQQNILGWRNELIGAKPMLSLLDKILRVNQTNVDINSSKSNLPPLTGGLQESIALILSHAMQCNQYTLSPLGEGLKTDKWHGSGSGFPVTPYDIALFAKQNTGESLPELARKIVKEKSDEFDLLVKKQEIGRAHV